MKRFFFVFIFLAFYCPAFFSQEPDAGIVRWTADPRIDKEVFQSEVIDEENFIYAALVASGADEAETKKYTQTLHALLGEALPAAKKEESAEQRAEVLLTFIYDRILKKYNFYQTLVTRAIDTGEYNCVSSALIFMYFAKCAGLPVVAVETPAHAFCKVYDGEAFFDVETTNPYGVNPGKKRSIQTKQGSGYLVVPAKNYQGRHDTDDRRAIAMVYDNRISYLQKEKKHFQTVGLAVDSVAVQAESALSLKTFDTCVLNCAAEFSKAHREREGIEFVTRAEGVFGKSKALLKYKMDATHNIVLSKIKDGPLDQALGLLESEKENLSSADYAELKEFVFLWNAQNAAKKADWPGAIKIAEQGLLENPKSKRLFQQKSNYSQNYAIDFHNKAADLFNSGKKEEALAVIKEGLSLLPENKILLQDLNNMK